MVGTFYQKYPHVVLMFLINRCGVVVKLTHNTMGIAPICPNSITLPKSILCDTHAIKGKQITFKVLAVFPHAHRKNKARFTCYRIHYKIINHRYLALCVNTSRAYKVIPYLSRTRHNQPTKHGFL